MLQIDGAVHATLSPKNYLYLQQIWLAKKDSGKHDATQSAFTLSKYWLAK